MIIGLVGPEGAGKSATMTWLALKHYARGGKVYAFPGYQVKYNGEVISEELRIEQWVTMPEELSNAMICIDEIQNFFDSARWNAISNRLFSYVGMQRRKRSLSIVYTTQNWKWAYERIRWLTHVLGECYDLYWSPWGKTNGIRRGELVRVQFTDLKGFFTGKEYQPLGGIVLRIKPLWEHFDSFGTVDVWQGFAKVKVNVPTLNVNFGEDEETEGCDGTRSGFQSPRYGADVIRSFNIRSEGRITKAEELHQWESFLRRSSISAFRVVLG